MEKEKKIAGFTRYSVDTLGNIYSSVGKNVNGKFKMKPFPTKKGYLHVSLWSDGAVPSRKDLKVHRLVAHAFIWNTENKEQVNHIDGDKSNNRVENLEWCTNQENQDHAMVNNLKATGFNSSSSKFSSDQIDKIYKMSDDGFSMRSIGRTMGVHHKSISLILNGVSYKEYYENNRRK